MNKIIVICGPTATGKSALAIEIAKLFNGEIISADSRQVYKGLDVGSAKVTLEEMNEIPHHMIDIADPTDTFTVSAFQKMTGQVIDGIYSRGKIPILCGGTGMYISAVINVTIFPEVPPNMELRQELETMTTDQLLLRLEELDPRRAGEIDAKNPIRLIRAIEIAEALGSVPPLSVPANELTTGETRSVLMIGLELPKEVLTARIVQRIDDRIPALFDEIKELHAAGVSYDRLHALGLEYRYGADYVQGKNTLQEFKELLATKTWQYVKRQLSWFKANQNIQWLNPISERQKILDLVQDFLK